MSFTPKKLPADSKALQVFYIGREKGLTQVQKGEVVWTHFKHVLKEYNDRMWYVAVDRARGRRVHPPIIYLVWTHKNYLRRSQSKGQWTLLETVRIDRPAEDDDLELFRIEHALETGEVIDAGKQVVGSRPKR